MAKIRATLRQLGLLNGLAYYTSVLLRRLSGGRVRLVKYDLIAQPLGIAIPATRRWGTSIGVREIAPDDPLMRRIALDRATVPDRLQQGARCLVAEGDDGELLGFLWFVEGPYCEDEVRCTFIPRPQGAAVWDFDVYVYPAHRLKPVFSRLWAAADGLLRQAGYRYTCSRISAFNATSRAAHQRLGGRCVGRCLFLCVGPVQLTLATVAPYVHLALRSGRGPRIAVG